MFMISRRIIDSLNRIEFTFGVEAVLHYCYQIVTIATNSLFQVEHHASILHYECMTTHQVPVPNRWLQRCCYRVKHIINDGKQFWLREMCWDKRDEMNLMPQCQLSLGLEAKA